MSDPYRRLFLDQLEVILDKEPSRKALLELLQTATPWISSLGGPKETKKHFKTLLLRVHPDKHPQDVSRSTRLCQDAQNFYDDCMATPPEPKRRRINSIFPLNFNANSKWSYILIEQPNVRPGLSKAEMANMVALQCINARGAIAHGRRPELAFFTSKAKSTTVAHTDLVFKVFKHHGGVKELTSIEEIKEEIMKNGPVVSTSFRPSMAFLNNNVIARSQCGCQKDILIVGWKQISSGEVWLVQPLYGHDGDESPIAQVAVGQLGIDEHCLAPTNTFDNYVWQSGPYYDANLSGNEKEWQTWESMWSLLDSLSELEPLFKELGTTSFSALQSPIITVRHKLKKAQSRKAYLRSIQWVKEKSKWKITFDFV
eukprot:CAMPEP_0202725438 /NCGR_PEP_ID=MMETSP1385-20130828/181982_1 /ASSEMBLY_ACC=CAM_ASM_000861 /TAXON_ID=933848 /ORGANISM="Elphidium margaritaceum" /LENGTH=369 /DNA_ID=CAMNT_0049391507 /DNA_START=46 /DNA_END=1155 /DNA_ORIENTATION=+